VLGAGLIAMDMRFMTLTPGRYAARLHLAPETVEDILWATCLPDDRLEHVLIRAGLDSRTLRLAMFLRPGPDPPTDTAAVALRVCLRAIDLSPALAGWVATLTADDAAGGVSRPT
jgi:hypothetical protein